MTFPKQFKKGDLVREANTPADEVSLKFDGFKEVVESANADVDLAPDEPFVTPPVVPTPGPRSPKPNQADK